MILAAAKPLDRWAKSPIHQEDGEKIYSQDDLIDAYLQGKEDQANKDIQVQFDELSKNLIKATTIAEEMYKYILSSGFHCTGVNMKIKDISRYTIMFLIQENDLFKEDFSNVYKESIRQKIANNNSDTFNISIVFAPQTHNFSIKTAISDGFILAYNI